MKRVFRMITALLLTCALGTTAYAGNANVSYSGDAGEFVFEPGSNYSLTDLFPDFKDLMPGDSVSQQITVKNLASNKVKVKVYMRALGAHEDGKSVEFLSQLHLTVAKSENNNMTYMFDAAANEAAQLTDWVLLGTLYSGGEINLDLTLDVPVEMGNEFADSVGYLDWEFMVEEFPVEDTDPKPPQTGDYSNMTLWTAVAAAALFVMIITIFRRKNR